MVDTTIPVITLTADATVTVEVGTTYTDAGATATDNYDGDITSNIVIVNNVNTAIVGTYTVTYNVTDANGNAANEVIRTVNVVAFNSPPTGILTTISLNQNDDDRNINLTDGITDPDGDDLTVENFNVTYKYKDGSGNVTQVNNGSLYNKFADVVNTASLNGNNLSVNTTLSNFLSGDTEGEIVINYDVTDGIYSISVDNKIIITGENDAPISEDEVRNQVIVTDVNGVDVLTDILEGLIVNSSVVDATDPDLGDVITYEISPNTNIDPAAGILTFNADGSYVFEAEEHFYGEVNLEYFIEDSFGAESGPYSVLIQVAESPDDDGIPSKLEVLGKSKDLDNDGMPDRKQNYISHFPMSNYSDFTAAQNWVNGNGGNQPDQEKYGAILIGNISDEAGNFDSSNYISDPNAKLKDLAMVEKPTSLSANIPAVFNSDFYQFSVIPEPGTDLTDLDGNPSNGLQTRIVLDLPTGIEATTYIKQDASGNYFSFKDDQDLTTFDDGATLIDTNGDGLINRIVITLTDNAPGDSDPEVGKITDPGSLGSFAPVVENYTTSSFNENQLVNVLLYDVNDINTNNDTDLEGDVLAYTISDTNSDIVKAAIKIDINTGELKVKDTTAFDFEAFVNNVGVANLEVNIIVSDQNGNTDNAQISIPISNIDEVPKILNATNINYLEQQNPTVVVLDIETLPDYQDSTTFEILTGQDGASMQIDASTGELRFKNSPFFADKQSYTVSVKATDIIGNSDTVTLTISILPLPIITGNDTINILEGATNVETYTANESVVWSISGTDATLFRIDSNTGVLTFNTAPDFDSPTDNNQDNTYELIVNATNANNNVSALAVNIIVGFLDLDDINPTITVADITVNVAANSCEAISVDLGTPITGDNRSVASTTNNAPTSFPIGETQVIWTVTDAAGNTATATQIVTVVDTIDPVAIAQDITIDIGNNPFIEITEADVNAGSTDNCSIVSIIFDVSRFDCSMYGENTVMMTVTDASGNTNTTSFVVTVTNCDRDSDGVLDEDEVTDGTDPLNPDSDGDGVLDGTEKTDGTDGLDSCDFVLASQTVTPSTAWNITDCDSDGVSNADEVTDGTDPLNPDTDGDGVLDGTEKTDGTDGLVTCDFVVSSQTVAPSTAWNTADCDSDGVTNADEVTDGTDPLKADTDGDGVIDGTEKTDGTDGLDFCSSIPSNITLLVSQDYLDADCDDDGLSNGDEIGPDVNNPIDSDNDGVLDYLEYNNHTTPIEDELEVFNLLTPNNDGKNDVFVIRNIDLYPENTIEIFNRWGAKVYNASGYGQNGRYFTGVSNARGVISQSSLLPTGTYFYILKYKSSSGELKERKGYLYLTR